MALTCILATLILALSPAQMAESYRVTRVVDGDTIWIERNGQVEKLRLLSVDTEEKIAGRPTRSRSKPETVFGEETRLWTEEMLAATANLSIDGGRARLRLAFAEGEADRDRYGRLLCHVLLLDGRDLNLLLVRRGLSPYYVKYGRSRICHADFVEAQALAQGEQLGIWNPAMQSGRGTRPYPALLAWWAARADAIDAFRARRHKVLEASRPEQLEAARQSCQSSSRNEVVVFGEVTRIFEEEDGSLTVLFSASDSENALRVVVPEVLRGGSLEVELHAATGEYAQNYFFVRGRVVRDERGFRMVTRGESSWQLAGPRLETVTQAQDSGTHVH